MTPLILAFGAGVLAALNPCAFAMLPSFASYFVASRAGPGVRRPTDVPERVLRALGVTAVVALGVLVVFAAAGGVVLVGFAALGRILPWVALALGVGLVGFGVALALGSHVPGLHLAGPDARRDAGTPVTVWWTAGAASALDARSIAQGRDMATRVRGRSSRPPPVEASS